MNGTDDLVRATFHRGGDTGCLLIHGFTCSPLSLKPLATLLQDKGFTVSNILLPGHGTKPEDMMEVGWQDWLKAVEAGLNELQSCPKVWLVGFSMGGVLAAIIAARHRVDGLVSIAAPVWPRPWQTRIAWLLKGSRRYIPMRGRRDFDVPCFKYSSTPVKSVAELMTLISIMKRELPLIKSPALIIQGDRDRTIRPRSASYIFDNLDSRDKELVWVKGGGHMLLLEEGREETCARIENFIINRAGG